MSVTATSNPSFGSSTTADEVASIFPHYMAAKTILITGVSALGIGGATALALAAQGPKLLILSGRSAARVEPVIASIKRAHPSVSTRFLQLDLASQASVRVAATTVLASPEPLDLLINNAGVMGTKDFTLSPEGIELQFATNHIGHFLLTNLLLPKLLLAAKMSSPGAVRVINVSSMGHGFNGVRFSDLGNQKRSSELLESERPNAAFIAMVDPDSDASLPYNPWAAYGASKTANVLFSVALNKRLSAKGVQSLALHPGSITTELTRSMDVEKLAEARARVGSTKTKNIEEGASTTLVAALDPKLSSGKAVYLDDCQEGQALGWATDKGLAEKLWEVSEAMVGEKFEW